MSDSIASIQAATDQSSKNLDTAGKCLQNAAQALRNNRVDVKVSKHPTYQKFHDELVRRAQLIQRVSLPVGCALARDLSIFCEDCAESSLEEYLEQLDETLEEIAKLRDQAKFAHEVSKTMTAEIKNLEDSLRDKLETLAEEAERGRKLKKGLGIGAAIVGGVGAIALTGGLGGLLCLAAGPAVVLEIGGVLVGAEVVAGGVVGAGLAGGVAGAGLAGGAGFHGKKAAEKSDLSTQGGGLLACAEKFSAAHDHLSTLLAHIQRKLLEWNRKSERIIRRRRIPDLVEVLGKDYGSIQKCVKKILESCSEFLDIAEVADSAFLSHGRARDAAVQEFFQTESLQTYLARMDPIAKQDLLETLGLEKLQIDGDGEIEKTLCTIFKWKL